MNDRPIKAVILDWAGTAVDFGSLAPVAALERVFEENGVPVTAEEIRRDMGTLKKDHIRAILSGERVRESWRERHGRLPGETDVERIFADFIPRQADVLREFSAPIPGTVETVQCWREAGMKIGSTTGYTRALLDVVIEAAGEQGYRPEASVTPDEVGGGRPRPFMCYRNAILLGVYPLWQCVKIGDTPTDIAEGLNAGMWTIGVTASGNEVGLSLARWQELSEEQRRIREQAAAKRLQQAGAHYTAPSLATCTEILTEIERRILSGERPHARSV